MSLTDEAEINAMFEKPEIKKHNPHFVGDGETCNYSRSRCLNTSACHDCTFYQTTVKVELYETEFKKG